MANLSKLTLAPRPVPVKSDPFEAAKAALLANLGRQLTSARAMLDGTPCPDVKRKWHFRDADGKMRFRMRVGTYTLAISDGLTNIVAGDEKTLPKTIETVIAALKAGELDEPIKKALSTRKPRKAKA